MATDASQFDVLFRGTPFGQSALQATAHIRSAWKSRLHCVSDWGQLRDKGAQDVYVVLPREALLDDGELQQGIRLYSGEPAHVLPVRHNLRK